ncbi:tetratricopeptide repeat protein [Frigoriglobus tundricola]|uniref:MalT-like TPR region domain-containing protein n=1 Tax=Frigoriglobus tundricola TaxID=2774151 RepID=A0A6M5YLL5_9BACT|nr:tetratricopeptide repeat protein [Frigoriglobus tundricola]QJW94927.1 hypothetical protein FTUN_2453 [Frigoriglobus tundricola]
MTSQIVEDVLATRSELSAEQKGFLTQVLADYRAFAGEGAEDELARRRVAAAAFRVGKIEDRLGRREEAVAAFRQALQVYALLATEAPAASGYQESLADCHNNLGIELSGLGHTGEAEAHYREALAIRDRLAAGEPGVAEHRRSLGVGHYNLGNLLRDSGRNPEARDQLQRAVALRDELAARPPHSSDAQREWAAALTALANVLADLGERAEAERLYAKAVPVLEQLTGAAPLVAEYRRELASALNGQGNLLLERKDWAAARGHLRRALALRERLAADSPGAAEALRELAMTLANLAQLYVHTGDRAAADAHFRRALAHFEKLAADHPNTQSYQVELGNTYIGFGVFVYTGGGAAECLSWFDKAGQRLTAVHEKDPRHALAKRQLCNSYRARAIAYDRLERWREAVGAWDRAFELGTPEVQNQTRAGRAIALLHAGEISRAVADVEALRGTDGWTAEQLYNFACVCSVATKTLERKQELADRAMELLRAAVATGWNDVALTKQDTDLDPLRARDDFKKLLTELGAKHPPKK